MSEICVVGSINMDVVTYVDVFPNKGQTIYGNKILEFPGGKGANQAISVARQGKPVTLISAVGNDIYGKELVDHLMKNHVDVSHIKTKSAKTGQTTIITDQEGDNAIILLEGANGELAPEDVIKSIQQLSECRYMLIQMETSHETIVAAMKEAKEQGIYVILDPAPATNVDDTLLLYADLILPNEHEAEKITGVQISDERTAKQAISILRAKGAGDAILKLGSKGSYVCHGDNITFVEGIKVDAIDAVGAGDSFAGAVASVLLDGEDLEQAAIYANIVAALKVTKEGAQRGIPSRNEVDIFCHKRNIQHYALRQNGENA